MATKQSLLSDPAVLLIMHAILTDRIQHFPEEDKNDLFKLVKILLGNLTTEEEEEAAVCDILKILEQTPIKITTLVNREQ